MNRRLFLLLNQLQQIDVWPHTWRAKILRAMGISVHPDTDIGVQCSFGGARSFFGQRVVVSIGCHFDASADIRIGDDVWIGPHVSFITGTHHIGARERRAGETFALPISVGSGTWIGTRALILPGVTIAPGCVIAAGTVVTKDTMPDAVYAGVPAKRVRGLEGRSPVRKLD